MTSDPNIWQGWARCAAIENVREIPPYVLSQVHPDCTEPVHAWSMLVGVERERHEAFLEVMVGLESRPNMGWSDKQNQYDQVARRWAEVLAYGDE
jgi:hypothetical protein